MNKYLSFERVSNPNTLLLCVSNVKGFLNLDFAHSCNNLDCSEKTK